MTVKDCLRRLQQSGQAGQELTMGHVIGDPAGILAPQALLATKLDRDPRQILTWFIQRWRLETTFEEARAHRGLATPRQWHDWSVSRTTPAVFGL